VGAQLKRELRGEVRADGYTRHLFATDASLYAREPLVVGFPRDARDVAAAIEVATRFELPVVTRGAGTSLSGQTTGQGIVLDTSRHMHAIHELDPQTLRARVGPGVVQEDLNRAAQPLGLWFGPDTSTFNRATIGGMIGNNSSGSHSIVYGSTIEHVHELEVVLSDGSRARLGPVDEAERARRAAAPTLEGALYRGLPEIVREHHDAIAHGYPKHWRQSGGYRLDRLAGGGPFDLARFVTGSEGTLVAITEATVGLVPLPKVKMFTVGHFESVAGAIAATEDALALGAAAIELLDKAILDLSRSKLEFRRLSQVLEGDPAALLYVTFFAGDEAEAHDRLEALETTWREHGHGYHALRAESAAEQDALTKVRKSALGLLMSASTGARRPAAFVEDTAVAPERLNDYVTRFREVLDRHGLEAGFYGHCSVGCLHIRPFVDLTSREGVETLQAVAEEIVDLVSEFDGVNSSEHGDGLVRSTFNRRVFGDDLYEAFRKVKALFDPDGRLNPGVMVDAPAMTENLRDPQLPAPVPLTTRLSFPGGMRAAADRCQRIGACRKTGSGVMCPSYMATREEEHATRGRANALVKALSSPDPRAAMGDDRLHEILDLCLECKACKSECPLSVDMASLKSEFLSRTTRTSTGCRCARGCSERSGGSTGSARNWRRSPTCPAGCRPCGPCWSARPASRAGARCPASRASTWCAGTGAGARPAPRPAARWSSSPTRSPPTLSPRSGVPRSQLLEAAGWRVRLESAGCSGGPASPRACSTRLATWPPAWSRGWPPRPSAACRSSAVSPPACSPCARSTSSCSRATRARRRSRAKPSWSKSCWWRRSTTVDCAWMPPRRSAAGRSSSTAIATRRRSPEPPRRLRCWSASRAPRSPSWTRAAAGWPARSGSSPSTTSWRCRWASPACSVP
jgi:FAD/FMN-containing dehydrogenase